LLPQRGAPSAAGTPIRSDAIPPQQAVLVLSESRQRHEEYPLFRPASFGGNGEHLGG